MDHCSISVLNIQWLTEVIIPLKSFLWILYTDIFCPDFWFQIHRLLNSPSVKHTTFNRGFDEKFIWGPEMAKSIIPMNAEQPAGWKPQWCSSMIVENECEKSESTMDAERTAGEIPGSGSI